MFKIASIIALAFDADRFAIKVLLLLLVMAFCLRLAYLGSKSLWLDEAYSLFVIEKGSTVIWSGEADPYHPPLFYWLSQPWVKFGNNEFMMRLPSAIFGSATILLFYIFAKNLINREVALSASGLMAFSPLLVWYSQEVRSYAWLCFLGLTVMIATLKLLLKPTVGWWILLIVSMTAGLYSHYFAILLLPLQLLLFIVLLASCRIRWFSILPMLLGWAVVGFAYWPWLQRPSVTRFINLALSGNNHIVQIFKDRFNITLTMATFVNPYIAISLVLVSIIILYLLYKLLYWENKARHLSIIFEYRWIQIGLVLLFLVLIILSVIPRGYTLKRQVVLLWPYGLLFFAWCWPWQKKYNKLLLSLMMVSIIGSLVNIVAIPKPQWREVAAFIDKNARENDLVILEPSYYTIPYDYYDFKTIDRVGLHASFTQDQLSTLFSEHNYIWLIVHGTDPYPLLQAQSWLNEHAILVNETDYYRLQVRLYRLTAK